MAASGQIQPDPTQFHTSHFKQAYAAMKDRGFQDPPSNDLFCREEKMLVFNERVPEKEARSILQIKTSA